MVGGELPATPAPSGASPTRDRAARGLAVRSLNRERAKAAILLGVLSGWLAGGGSPVHSVALTDEGLGVLRARRIID
jgi:hypothetical protein